MKKFWSMKALGESSAELLLYGEISETSWWGDEVTPAQFDKELQALGVVNELHVRVHSPGGDVFAASAIYTMLRRHSARVVMHVDGLAASAATIVLMAGDTIIMPINAMLMIHNPWTVAMGNAGDLRQSADALDAVKASMMAAYAEKTGLPSEELAAIMDAETWYTAEEAVAQGFADELEDMVRVATSISAAGLTVNGYTIPAAKLPAWPAARIAALLHTPTPESLTGDDDTPASETPAGGAAEAAKARIRNFLVKELLK